MTNPALKSEQILAQIAPGSLLERKVRFICHFVVLIFSILLIVFISYDTFSGVNFLENHLYMTFQFFVCILFMADFFIEWALAQNKRSYVASHWFFFLISIPYLNVIHLTSLQITTEALYYVRFIPLVRGAYALAMVVGYFSTNRAYSLLTQYAAILMSILYFASIIFYYEEGPVNSDVNTYWDALYWAAMNVDTVGCYINAVTVGGKVLSVVLAVSGMMMLPLFTVYITARVKNYNDQRRRDELLAQQILAADGHGTSAQAPQPATSAATESAAKPAPDAPDAASQTPQTPQA